MTPAPQYYPVTKDELNFIKNDCEHPETDSCEGCELDTPEGCTFVGANILMDEVLSRPPVSASSDVLDTLERKFIVLNQQGDFRPWNIGHIRDVIAELRNQQTKEREQG